jgi:subtilisin family serine protease
MHGAQPSLFGPDQDNRVPGEVILKLAAQAAPLVAALATGPARLIEGELSRTLGLPGVDAVLAELGVTGIFAVHGAPHPPTISALMTETASELSKVVVAQLPMDTDLSSAVDRLNSAAEVQAAEPNRFREAQVTTPNDPEFAAEWGLQTINAPTAWDTQRGDPSIVVAVVDTGIDLDHPDLVGNLVAGADFVDLKGVPPGAGFHFEGDVLTPDDVPEDEVGHGTHVAGTIAAVTDNGTDVAGVAWTVGLMPVRVLGRVVRDSDGFVSGTGTAVDIAAGIRHAVDHGASIINLSLGSYGDAFVERDAIAYAVAANVLVVAAMGNDNTTNPMFPAAYPGVLAVGAIGQDERRAPFSNTGPHIGVAGPGVDIRSTFLGGGTADLSGTSMASPHVAGVAALVRSADGSLTAAQVRDRLKATARPLRDTPADPIPNERYGSGVVDAAAALGVGPGPGPTPPPPWPGRYFRFPPMTVGDDVAAWQTRMNSRGFGLKVDGKYGPKSKAACVSLQQQMGLQVDGIVGPDTWDATFGD